MDITFVVVNYNTTELTLKCIGSIYQHTLQNSFEVVLVDNASIEFPLSQFQYHFPDLRIISNLINLGFAKANNQGIRISKGKYLFLLNSDASLTSDAAADFFKYMEDAHRTTVACCGAALVRVDGTPQISYGNFPSLAEVIAALGPGLFYKKYFQRHLSSGVKVYRSEPYPVDYVSGADLFIRKSVLNEIGLLDEDFFLYFEETELAYRMRKKGYTSVIIPKVEIIHLESGSHDAKLDNARRAMFSAHRNLFFKKCYGPFNAFLAKHLYIIQGFLYNAKRKYTRK